MSGGIQVERAHIAQAVQSAGPEWRALADAVEDATIFMRPAAAALWETRIAQGMAGSVLLARRGGALVGVLPLMTGMVRRGPAMVPRIDYAPYDRDLAPPQRRPFQLRQTTHLMSWRMANMRPNVLCRAEDRRDVFGAFAQEIATDMRADQIVMPAYCGAQAQDWLTALGDAGLDPWLHNLGRSFVQREVMLPAQDIIAAQSRNFRRKMARAQKAADEMGLVTELISGRSGVQARMGAFADLARKSWKADTDNAETIGITYDGPQRDFVEALLAEDDAGVVPVMISVQCDGTPTMMGLFCCHGPTLSALFTFWDGRVEKASPGYLGLVRGIDWASEQGLRRIDLNATQPWLKYFADEMREVCHVVAFRRSLKGRLLDAIARRRADQLPTGTG